jgi:hypothetical protein
MKIAIEQMIKTVISHFRQTRFMCCLLVLYFLEANSIGIGFLFGGCVFLGNPGLLDCVFGGLRVFWVSKGIYRLVR